MHKGFPPDVRHALTQLAPYTGIIWQRDGEPGIIIKLPANLPFPLVPVGFDRLRREPSSMFSLAVQLQQRGHRTIPVECRFAQRGRADTQIVQALLAATQLEVYAVTPQLTFLGTQLLPWPDKKRRQLAQLAHDLLTPHADIAVHDQVSPSHATYQQTLQHLHFEELKALLEREAAEPVGQWTTVPLVQSTHTFEEQVLAAVHRLDVTESQARQFATSLGHDPVARIDFPNFPFWIECQVPIKGANQMIAGAVCFRATYEPRTLIRRKGVAYYRAYDRKSRWRLDFVDAHGTPLLRLLSSASSLNEIFWRLDPSHLCPAGLCRAGNDPPSARRSSPSCCEVCTHELAFWQRWSNTLLALALHQPLVRTSPQPAPSAPAEPPGVAPVPQEIMHAALLFPAGSAERRLGTATSGSALAQGQPPVASAPLAARPSVSPPARKPVIVTHALLIDRYIRMQRIQQEQIEQAQKFLWMHSAQTMAEALLPGVGDDALLRLPQNPVYIEFEQPRPFAGIQVAACSFLCLSADERTKRSRWRYTLIADNGAAARTLFYAFDGRKQQGRWSLPGDDVCPENRCRRDEPSAGQLFTLCPACQAWIDHVTAWITVALRMLAGDFQERVELRQPEEVLETSKQLVRDEQTGETKEKTILHRFRVIRYYDACVRRENSPQTRRGSWMSDRPLAESEYDVNPHAIIFVQIEPRDYERTYRHERYVHMRGKSQYIDPKARLQPMTIATFRQLPRQQRMTKVYASSFEE